MEIRLLTFPCPDIEPLMRAFYAEHNMGGLTHLPLNVAKARNHANRYFTAGVVFGAYEGAVLAGSIALGPSTMWWSDSPILSDGWFFVHPKYRNGTVATRLLKAAKQYAEARGLPLYVDVSHSVDLERKAKFFERQGFTAAGSSFVYGA
ncbi:MAG TPA: GNAT family N-acetyltransferase [Alphaproteobacteria bacterium]|nr:GNAT family N-acetyltransferase [Alphaproteobacteria bacterium]